MHVAKNPSSITLSHAMPLFSEPRLDAPIVTIVYQGMHSQLLGYSPGFLHIRCETGAEGFVPSASCAPEAIPAADGAQPWLSVVQPVLLYSIPVPGGQFVAPAQRMIHPREVLLLLGRDSRFLFVQCEDGRIGYVPAVLCGTFTPVHEIIKLGPIDLGWVGLGCAWALPNLSALTIIFSDQALIERLWQPYCYLGSVLVTISILWLSPRRRAGRSFALGLLLYALLHLMFWGRLTLWY